MEEIKEQLEKILASLKKRYETSTYQALGEKAGISGSYVRDLIVGRRSIQQITLDVLFKLFPNARIDLGTTPTVNVQNNSAPFAINQSSVNIGNSADTLKSAIINAIIDLDIPPEALKKVLKTIKDTEVKV